MLVTLDQALDTVLALPDEHQEMLVKIVSRRQIERQRHQIFKDALDSQTLFREGKLEALSAEQAIAELRRSLNETTEL